MSLGSQCAASLLRSSHHTRVCQAMHTLVSSTVVPWVLCAPRCRAAKTLIPTSSLIDPCNLVASARFTPRTGLPPSSHLEPVLLHLHAWSRSSSVFTPGAGLHTWSRPPPSSHLEQVLLCLHTWSPSSSIFTRGARPPSSEALRLGTSSQQQGRPDPGSLRRVELPMLGRNQQRSPAGPCGRLVRSRTMP